MTIALFLIGGAALLALGGELLVHGAVKLAARMGVSPLLAGLTIVGFGTSAPELVTSIIAALRESPDIALGNVVGSNIANILLIVGAAALIMPIAVARGTYRRDAIGLTVGTAVTIAAMLHGEIDRAIGAGMLVLFVLYMVWAYLSERGHESGEETPQSREHLLVSVAFAVAGIAATIIGARLLVSGAVDLALELGMSETVIGLTIVAVGTSLPELVTSVVAAIRRHSEVALGNVIGSCLYNLLAILGLTAVIHPLSVDEHMIAVDIWVLGGTAALLIGWLLFARRIGRLAGALSVAAYGGYVAFLTVG